LLSAPLLKIFRCGREIAARQNDGSFKSRSAEQPKLGQRCDPIIQADFLDDLPPLSLRTITPVKCIVRQTVQSRRSID
jgi:hypothetical protein